MTRLLSDEEIWKLLFHEQVDARHAKNAAELPGAIAFLRRPWL